MVELHLTHASITDTDLVDGSGKLAYRVSTPFHGGTTTISRSVGDAMIAVAQLEWHPWDPDIVRYCEQERQADAYLLEGRTSGSRSESPGECVPSFFPFRYPAYGCCAQQLELHGGPEVARSHNRSFGLVGKRAHDAYLEVH
ncbi:hypothetical protein OF83DRAFT_1116311, partial [Amylostereum chailletii]